MTFVVQFHFNLPTPTTRLALLQHNNELPWIRHNESASTCSGICLWISYGDLKHFTYACLPVCLASRHEHGHSGNGATLNGNANNCNCMRVLGSGFWLWVCDWINPCLGCRDRNRTGPSRRMSERTSRCPAARRIQSVLLQAVQIPGGHKFP